MSLFNIPEYVYNAAVNQVSANEEASTKNLANGSSDRLPPMYTPDSYLNISGKPSEVFTIDKGKERGTTFKINTGGYVFSCLFDTGAEISSMSKGTVATLELMGQFCSGQHCKWTKHGSYW